MTLELGYYAHELLNGDGTRRRCEVRDCAEMAVFAWSACAKASTTYVCPHHDTAINDAILSVVAPKSRKRYLGGYRRRQAELVERAEKRLAELVNA